MLVLRLLILAALPVFDLAVGVFVSGDYRAKYCGEGICWPLVLIAANGALTWATIYAALFLLAIAAARLPAIILRVPLFLGLGFCALFVVVLCAFAWAFGLNSGFLPSGNIVIFALDNAMRTPQNLLQTAPVKTLMLAVAILLLSLVLARLMTAPARRVSLPRGAWTISFALIMAAKGTYLTAPHVTAKFSAIAFNKMLLVRLDPSFDDYQLDTALAATFVERAPAQPVTRIKTSHSVIVILIESLCRVLIEMEPSPLPFMKALATRGGIYFDKAYATASHSNYADVAFWYSRHPMRSLGLQTYPKDGAYRGTSIFKLMKQNGYTTGYISSQNELWGSMVNWLNLPGEVGYFYHSENFAGDTWYNREDKKGIGGLIRKRVATAGKIEDSQTLQIASRWIESLGKQRRFFQGMNLQNTHFSYVNPPGGITPYQPAETDAGAIYYL